MPNHPVQPVHNHTKLESGQFGDENQFWNQIGWNCAEPRCLARFQAQLGGLA